MRITIPRKASVLLLASALIVGASASAATIYNNSVFDSNLRFGPPVPFGTTEFGDEIILAGTQQQRMLTEFSFEFWALNNNTTSPAGFSPSASARIRFYLNNGPLFGATTYATPGTVFYDSGTFPLGAPTDRLTFHFFAGVDFPAIGLYMPVVSNMTWTVQFSGLDADDTAGLDVYDPPVTGSSYNDYWEFSGGSWGLKTNVVPMNFAARFEATVPEPSTVVFGVLGGLGLLVFGRRLVQVRK